MLNWTLGRSGEVVTVPDGEFMIVVLCADCGRELKRTKTMTARRYAEVLLRLTAPPCPNGCRSTFTDLNMNTRYQWQRPDGTPIEQEQ